MPRPRKGQAAKDQPVTVRLTEGEARMLAKVFGGTPGYGLRRVFDQWKDQKKNG